jgi:hypothetical protein
MAIWQKNSSTHQFTDCDSSSSTVKDSTVTRPAQTRKPWNNRRGLGPGHGAIVGDRPLHRTASCMRGTHSYGALTLPVANCPLQNKPPV